jgi:hypothetical protein
MGTALLSHHQNETSGIDGLNAVYKITNTYHLVETGRAPQSAQPSDGLRRTFEAAVKGHAQDLAGTNLEKRQVRFHIQKNLRGGDRYMLTLRVPIGDRVQDVFHQKAVCDVTVCENIQTGQIYRLNQRINRSRFLR